MDTQSPSSRWDTQRLAWLTRAGQAGDERRKALLSYCVAAVGAYFLRLTGVDGRDLCPLERHVLLLASMAFGVGVLSGVLAWHFAGRYFHARGMSRLAAQPRLHCYKNFSDHVLAGSFGAGVALTVIFLALRLMSV